MHTENAEDEIYLLVGDEVLLEEKEVLDALETASNRGVTVLLEVPSEGAKERIREEFPSVQVALSDLELSPLPDTDRQPGRLVMIDRETILMSAVEDGLVPDETAETGLWGSEVGHGLVVWLRELLGSRIEMLDFTT